MLAPQWHSAAGAAANPHDAERPPPRGPGGVGHASEAMPGRASLCHWGPNIFRALELLVAPPVHLRGARPKAVAREGTERGLYY